MRNGFLGVVAVLLAGAGLVRGQDPFGPAPGMDGPIGYPAPMNPEASGANSLAVGNFWAGIDFLGFYQRRRQFNYPIVSTSTAGNQGIIGAPTTSVLYDGPDDNEFQIGGRVTAGFLFPGDNRFGLEFSGFVMGNGEGSYTISSNGSGTPLIARPFFDASTATPSSYVVASTSVGSGDITVNTNTQVWGAESHLLLNLYRSSPMSPWGFNLNVFAGVSVLSLRESISIVSSTQYFRNVSIPFNNQTFIGGSSLTNVRRELASTPPSAIVEDTETDTDSNVRGGTVDRYRTSSQFYGAQIGFAEQMRFGRWSIGLTGKLSLGAVQSNVEIDGYSSITRTTDQTIRVQRYNVAPQGTTTLRDNTTSSQSVDQQTVSGGIYAVNGQIGRYQNTTYAYMPEGILTVSYQFTPTISASLGYSFQYLNKVVRVPDVMNQHVDQVLQPTSSIYGFRGGIATSNTFFPYTSYWIQGINAGLSIQF